MKIAKKHTSTSPSPAVNTSDFPCPSQISFHKKNTTSIAKNAKGTSFQVVDFLAFSVVISADNPRMRRMLTVLLPIIFPIAISVFPLTAAVRLTTSSGADVPKATTVSPMTIVGTPAIFERDPAHLTSISAA